MHLVSYQNPTAPNKKSSKASEFLLWAFKKGDSWSQDSLVMKGPFFSCSPLEKSVTKSEILNVFFFYIHRFVWLIPVLHTLRIQTPSDRIGSRGPVPSEKNRNVGGPIPFLGHTHGSLGIHVDKEYPTLSVWVWVCYFLFCWICRFSLRKGLLRNWHGSPKASPAV